MARRSLTGIDVLFRVLLASAGAAALIAGAAVAVRPRERTNRPLDTPEATPAARVGLASGDVVLIGWARTVSGRRGKYRAGLYTQCR